MKVGVMLPQAPEDGGGGTWREILALARRAEDGGADSLWLCDHFFHRPPQGGEVGYHEAWTLLSALSTVTQRVELGTLVLATSFRPPGLLAKMASTADDVSGGRLILGLGCGWYEPEYRSFGYPFDHRVGRFEEAISVIAPLLRGERVTFEGRWTQADDAFVLPRPRRRVPVLVAARRERMLRLAARFADVWQTAWFAEPDDRFAQERDAFLAACQDEGRDAAGVGSAVGLVVGETEAHRRPDRRSIPLDPGAIADALGAWAAEGVAHVQLGMPDKTAERFDVLFDGLRRFRA